MKINSQESIFSHPQIDKIDKPLYFVMLDTDGEHIFYNNLKKNKQVKQFPYWGGNNTFFDINPTLFKYSKKESTALLGSANNLGNPLSSILSLKSIHDSNRFEEDYTNDPLNKYRYPLKNVAEINNAAGAIGYKNKITPETSLYTNFVWQSTANEQRQQSINQFITPEINLIETTSNVSNNNLSSYSLNLELNSKISTKEEFHFNFSAGNVKNKTINDIETEINTNKSFITNNKENQVISLKNKLGYYKKFNSKLITYLNINLENILDNEKDFFISNQPLFEGIIEFNDALEILNIQQRTKSNRNNIDINSKNYFYIFI